MVGVYIRGSCLWHRLQHLVYGNAFIKKYAGGRYTALCAGACSVTGRGDFVRADHFNFYDSKYCYLERSIGLYFK